MNLLMKYSGKKTFDENLEWISNINSIITETLLLNEKVIGAMEQASCKQIKKRLRDFVSSNLNEYLTHHSTYCQEVVQYDNSVI